jgi:hypothetical protein
MTQPILIAPVTRVIARVLDAWLYDLRDGDVWGELTDEEISDVACDIADSLNPRPDPDDPCKWWITLPSADGTLPQS